MPKKTLQDYVNEINHLCGKYPPEPGSYELLSYSFNGQQVYSLNIGEGDETTCEIHNLTHDQMVIYLVGVINTLVRCFKDHQKQQSIKSIKVDTLI